MTLARHFEESSRPNAAAITNDEGVVVDAVGKPLTPSEALRQRHQHLRSLHTLASQFGARLVDVSDHSVIVEMTGKTARVEAFLALVKPYGIIESARTGAFFFFFLLSNARLGRSFFSFTVLTGLIVGLMAMPRTPIAGLVEEDASGQGDSVDASLLPPG